MARVKTAGLYFTEKEYSSPHFRPAATSALPSARYFVAVISEVGVSSLISPAFTVVGLVGVVPKVVS